MTILGGASVVRREPVFANDGKRLLVCTSSSVTVLSVATALPVLHLSGHTDSVTSVIVVPPSGHQEASVDHAWTSSLDGTIRLWDFKAGTLLKTVKVGKPVESMVIPSLFKASPKAGEKVHEDVAFLSVRQEGERSAATKGKKPWKGRVILVNLSKGKALRRFLAKTVLPRPLVVSPQGGFVGMPDRSRLWVWIVPDGTLSSVEGIKRTYLHPEYECRIMAFDPTETVVAGGDDRGRILCWHNVGDRTFSAGSLEGDQPAAENAIVKGVGQVDDDVAACTIYHWHAHQVRSLQFSSDGTYLFSGGSEGVLVIWQTETGKQQFLPRLGGHLLYITASPDPSLFAISFADNAIRFVNIGSMSVERTWQGIKPPILLPKHLRTSKNAHVVLSPHGNLVLPTGNVALQFYDAIRDQQVYEVQVTPRTNLTGAKGKDGSAALSNFVTHVTFSKSGSIMATVDVRLAEGDIGGGLCLKFWDHDSKKRGYHLNTVVDAPHSAELTALVYHPLEDMVVSCSRDATFKVWIPRSSHSSSAGTDVATSWRCRSVASYRHKEILAAAFSPDGTLLAIAAEELITLWNPRSNGFLTCLVCSPPLQAVVRLAFIPHSKCLVAATSGDQSRLLVWDLFTLSLLWSFDVDVEALSVDPIRAQFGIIALPSDAGKSIVQSKERSKRGAVLALFNLENPLPSAAWSIHEGEGATLFFNTADVSEADDKEPQEKSSPQSHLIVMTRSREYLVFNPNEPDDVQITTPAATATIPENPSAYLAMYGKASQPKIRSGMDVVGVRAPKPWGNLFDAPSHVLPSLTRIGITFMESLLEKNTTSQKDSLRAEGIN